MIQYDPKRTVPNWVPGSWQYLETLLSKDRSWCFEWGGGQSTKWLADRAACVVTVENDLAWAKTILSATKGCDNCQLVLASKGSRQYVVAVFLVWRMVNVFLIDGYQRIECLKEVRGLLRPGDILVLDDALDYVEDWCPPTVRRFSMPHPHAGKPVTRNDWGNTTLKVGDMHHDKKETWVWRVD